MLYVIESSKPLDRVAEDLQVAVARHKFGVLGVHDLKAKKVLEANLAISTALPCRISVYEEGGITKLTTIKPTALTALYPTPELQAVAEDVETTLERIMAEAARVGHRLRDGGERAGVWSPRPTGARRPRFSGAGLPRCRLTTTRKPALTTPA
jgi:uncharacterized protein (DUF302 family)